MLEHKSYVRITAHGTDQSLLLETEDFYGIDDLDEVKPNRFAIRPKVYQRVAYHV